MALKVFYNGACPVCRAGIEKQRGDMAGCPVPVDWNDVHDHPQEVTALGYELEKVRERLHVMDAAGRMHIGAAAFSLLFRHTPRRGWIAALMDAPGLRRVFAFAYDRFAAALYRWNRRRGRW
jgi:predicted DCC family thiol-disulfide oxidoreductase YuxK